MKIIRTTHQAYFNRGSPLAEKRDYERAVADFDAAIKLEPSFALAFNERGNAQVARGRIPIARSPISTRRSACSANYDIAYLNRGAAYRDARRDRSRDPGF